MHRALYRDGLTLEQAKVAIAGLGDDQPGAAADVKMMLDFLANISAQRGLVR